MLLKHCLVPEGPNVYSYVLTAKLRLQRSRMSRLHRHIALRWSADPSPDAATKHLAALRPIHNYSEDFSRGFSPLNGGQISLKPLTLALRSHIVRPQIDRSLHVLNTGVKALWDPPDAHASSFTWRSL